MMPSGTRQRATLLWGIVVALSVSCSDDPLAPRPKLPAQDCPPCYEGSLSTIDVPYALSSCGDTLIYGHAGTDSLAEGIYLLDIERGSSPKYLMPFYSVDRSDPNRFSFRFSPDNSQLAYTSGRGGGLDMWVLDIASGMEEQVTFTYGNCETGDWDPSGRFLVYSRPFLPAGAPDTSAGLFVIDTETLEERPLVRDGQATFGSSPRWSPDSSRIVLWSGAQRGTVLHVFSINPDGSDLRDLTPGFLDNCQAPVWIEGGTRILFEVFDRTTFALHNTRVMQSGGGGNGLWPIDLYLPRSVVSRDGRFFAYTAPDSTGTLGVVYRQATDDPSGSSRRQITIAK